MSALRTEILDDVEAIHNAQVELRAKISLHHKSFEDSEADLLNHPLDDYLRCIPLLDDQALTTLLDQDIVIWSKKGIKKAEPDQQTKESRFGKLIGVKDHICRLIGKGQQVREEVSEPIPQEITPLVIDKKEPEQEGTKVNLLGFKTVLTRLPLFGDESLQLDWQWPEPDQLKRLPLDKKIKLSQITYKSETNSSLQWLQLGFTNDVHSPLFEAENSTGVEWRSVDVDSKRKIRKIVMCVHKNNTLRKLRMLDDAGHAIVDLVWYDYEEKCKQIVRELPIDKEIIGLYGSRQGGTKLIQSLGFIAWTPNRYAKD